MPLCVRLTCVWVSLRAINSDMKIEDMFFLLFLLLLRLLSLLWLFCRWIHCLIHWNRQIQRSTRTISHYTTVWCLGHTKCNGVQRVYCNPFPAKPLYGSHRLDLVMIRPPGIDNGAFVVTPDSVWYTRVLLLFSASAQTDTGSKSFDCALVSTLETYDDPENGN